MASRFRYAMDRVKSIASVMLTPMGLVAVGAAAVSLLAVAIGGNVGVLLAAVAIALWLVAILVLGDRIRTIWAERSDGDHSPGSASALVHDDTSDTTTAVVGNGSRTGPDRALSQIAQQPSQAPHGVAPGTSATGPLVSVIVSCFDNGRSIVDTLQSVVSQTYAGWECIVVDDASTDSSLRSAWDFARTDSRIRIVRHTRHVGVSAARNTGLRLASGEFVTFLEATAFLAADSLADRVLHVIPHANEPEVAGVYCGTAPVPTDARHNDYADGGDWFASGVSFVTHSELSELTAQAVLAKTPLVRAAGGFDEARSGWAGDADLWYRVLRNGFRFEPAGRLSVFHRREGSLDGGIDLLGRFDEARRLSQAAYQRADESIVFSPDANPMLRPRSDYEVSVPLVRSVIRWAAGALLRGDEQGASRLLESVEPMHPTVLSSEVRPNEAIDEGFSDYLGIPQSEMNALRSQLSPVAEHAARLVAEGVPTETVEVMLDAPELDIVLLPQTASQIRRMLESIGETDLRVGVIDSSAAAGDQGVADALSDISIDPRVVQSYNEALLTPTRCRVVVLSHPWDVAIDELALQYVADGAAAVVLQGELDDVVQVADAPPSRVPVSEVTAGQLASACRTSGIEELTGDVTSNALPTFDTSLLGYRDAASVWTREEYPDRAFDASTMTRFAGIHAGERVVIIGNGPSLNDLDLSLLRGTHTIGVNGIFYADDRLPERLSYYVVEDTAVVRDNLERVQNYEAGHRFFPSIYREMIGESSNTTFFMMNRGFYEKTSPAFCVPRFSTNAAQRLYTGQSVTTMNLQLAYYMGFTEVILIGMDFSYAVPASSEIDGDEITSRGDDPNHFHPDYFGSGKVWKDPKLDRVLSNYALAKQMFESDGRRIVNATPGGNLDLFERASLEELLS